MLEVSGKLKSSLDAWLGRSVLLIGLGTIILSFFDYEIPNEMIILDAVLVISFFAYYTITEGLTFYVLRRLAQTAFVMWVIATLVFAALRAIPGGPFDEEKVLAPEIKAAIEEKYHLRDPLLTQYFRYLTDVAQGKLGYSYKYVGREVNEIIAESFPVSFQLGIFSLILAFLVGIPSGIYAASKHNTWKDTLTMVASISSVSLPSFLVAAILITVFCFWLELLPPALWEGTEYFILPVLVLGLRPAAMIARLTRASVLDVIRSDYIRTARAKGISETSILYKHVLKNSLIPVLTFAGPQAAFILSGTFVIEHIFSIPGIGKHLIQSISNRDYPLILGVTLLSAFMLVIFNLVVDILYTYFDPRIKLS